VKPIIKATFLANYTKNSADDSKDFKKAGNEIWLALPL